MAKVIEMTTKKASAADIRARLEAGKQTEADLVVQRDQAALDEMDGVTGAAALVASLNARIVAVRAERQTLEGVYRLAIERERLDDIRGRSKIRASQLAAMQSHAREREATVAEMLDAAQVMAAAMQRYGAATRKFVGVVPIGTRLPVLALGPSGVLGSALGNLEQLLAVELYRSSVPDADGQRFLVPFAKPMTLTSDDATQIPPALDVFREGQTSIIAEIKAQLEQIEAKEMATLGTPLKEAV